MKREWTDSRFAEWTLLPSEAALLANKTGPTRLGFAVLLKFLSIVCVKFSKMRSGKSWRNGKAHSFGQPPKVEPAFFVRAAFPC